MMYPYMTLYDGTEIVHSQIIEEDNIQKIIVHFERPTDDGFDDARCVLPEYKWTQRIKSVDGFHIGPVLSYLFCIEEILRNR